MKYTVVRFNKTRQNKSYDSLKEACSQAFDMDIITCIEEGVVKRMNSYGKPLSEAETDAWYDMRNSQMEFDFDE